MNPKNAHKLLVRLREKHTELGILLLQVAEALEVDDDEVFAWQLGNVSTKQRKLLQAVVEEGGRAGYKKLLDDFAWAPAALGQVRGRSPFIKEILKEEVEGDDWFYVMSETSLRRLQALL